MLNAQYTRKCYIFAVSRATACTTVVASRSWQQLECKACVVKRVQAMASCLGCISGMVGTSGCIVTGRTCCAQLVGQCTRQGIDLLHDEHVWQATFFGLQLLGQLSSPCFQAHMNFAQFLQLSLFSLCLVHVDGIVEEVHQIAGYLAQL
jgi:hypothetical protein